MNWVTDIQTVAELREAEDNLQEEIAKHDQHEETYRIMLVELRAELASREG